MNSIPSQLYASFTIEYIEESDMPCYSTTMSDETDYQIIQDPEEKLSEKIFYIPSFSKLNIESGTVKILKYLDPEHETIEKAYASKVSPGQSLNEAVTEDLEKDFGYTGSVDVSSDLTWVDQITDKKGRHCNRYEVEVLLSDDLDTRRAQPLGYELVWEEIDLLQEEDKEGWLSELPSEENVKDTDIPVLVGVLYIPIIYHINTEAGILKTLNYFYGDFAMSPEVYSSKVSSGQSLTQAIASDLKHDFGYENNFFVIEYQHVDQIEDDEDVLRDRYKVKIVLLKDLDIQSVRPLGYGLWWVEEDLPQEDKTPQEYRVLSAQDTDELGKMLKVRITYDGEDEETGIEFDDLVFEPDISVSDDWKWDDLNIFKQIKEVAPELELEYDHESGFNADGQHPEGYKSMESYLRGLEAETWHLTFKMLGEEYTVTVRRLDIDRLMGAINNVLKAHFGKEFIKVETYSDSILYLLVPSDMDVGRFEAIIHEF